MHPTQQKQLGTCKHWVLWGHVQLEVLVVSGWRTCSLSDAFLVLTRIRPHCLEETGSPRIRDLPVSIADLRADRCLVMLRARLLNSSVSLGFWVTLAALQLASGFQPVVLWCVLLRFFTLLRRKLCCFKCANHNIGVSLSFINQRWNRSAKIFSPKITFHPSSSMPEELWPLKSLNTWVFCCISQLATSNPQSCMSSKVNGFGSCPLTSHCNMSASVCDARGHRASENLSPVELFPFSLRYSQSSLFPCHFLMW